MVAVPVGGGGLLAGVSGGLAAIDRRAPQAPAGRRRRAGRLPDPARGGRGGRAGRRRRGLGGRLRPRRQPDRRAGASAAYRANPVGLALVSDKEIIAARDRLWEDFRLAVEPAAATVFAAWLSGQVPGAHPCLVLSGANATWTPA